MMKRTRLVFFVVLALALVGADFAFSGFGITPPYVRNEGLTRNSIYTQKIIIVRGDPTEDLKAVMSMDVPGANEWFVVNRGNEFILPKGEQKVPIEIKVKVPDEADIKRYRGNIRIRTLPIDESAINGVSIALGAQIDVDINVVDREIYDFRVKKISLSDLNEGHTRGWFYFPGKIRFKVTIENTGNVSISPSRVLFNIYDGGGEKLLEATENSNRLPKVKPFESGDLVAELPTRLAAGSYIVRYKIFNKDDLKQEGELNLSILPFGTLPDDSGYGLLGLTSKEKAIIVLPFLLAVSLILFVAISIKGRRSRRSGSSGSGPSQHILRLGGK